MFIVKDWKAAEQEFYTNFYDKAFRKREFNALIECQKQTN